MKKRYIFGIFIFVFIIITIYSVYNITNKKSEKKSYKEISKCDYKYFAKNTADNYMYSEQMIYNNNIYYMKIDSYEEYKNIKLKWEGIHDISENYFNNYFMIISEVENVSMLGLVVDNIETDDETLYIKLIKDPNNIIHDESETCISYVIPREMERKNILIYRDLNNSERIVEQGMKLQEDEVLIFDENRISISCITEEQIEQYNNSEIKINLESLQDYIIKEHEIEKKNINLKNWKQFANGVYYLEVNNYSQYAKNILKFNVPNLIWYDFKNMYNIFFINAHLELKKDENNNECLNIRITNNENIEQQSTYNIKQIFLPNYRNVSKGNLKIDF